MKGGNVCLQNILAIISTAIVGNGYEKGILGVLVQDRVQALYNILRCIVYGYNDMQIVDGIYLVFAQT